jgi:hypothetical protein
MIRYRYIPSSAAESLSAALLRLSDPHPEGKMSQFLFGSVVDLHGEKWLMVDTTLSLPIHPDAELNGIADILQPWIDGGHLPEDTNTTLAALVESKRGGRLVESKRGGRLVVYDAFPQLFKDMSKDHAEMIAAGLLAEPQMP